MALDQNPHTHESVVDMLCVPLRQHSMASADRRTHAHGQSQPAVGATAAAWHSINAALLSVRWQQQEGTSTCDHTKAATLHKPGGLVLLLQGRSLADLADTVVRALALAASAAVTAQLHGFEQVAALQRVGRITGLHHHPIERGLRVRRG